MEGVLIDQSPVNPRKGFVVNNSSRNGGYMTRSHKSFSSSSYSSVSQLFLNLNAGSGSSTASFGLFGSRPPPPRHASLPSFSAAPSMVAPPPPFLSPTLHQPPLLPLPFSKTTTLPSPTPTKRIAAVSTPVTNLRSRDGRKKTRPAASPPRKEARSTVTTAAPSDLLKGESESVVSQKPARKPTSPPEAAVVWEEELEEGKKEREEGFSMESVYLLSPHPSSLPLPTFFLKRPKAAPSATSCIAEAMGCGGTSGSGPNSGATDDLRRLLRL